MEKVEGLLNSSTPVKVLLLFFLLHWQMVYDEACHWCWTPLVALNIAVPHLQWSKSCRPQMFSFNHLWSPKVSVIKKKKKKNPPGSSLGCDTYQTDNDMCHNHISLSVYSHNSRGALCLLACPVIDSNWLSSKILWYRSASFLETCIHSNNDTSPCTERPAKRPQQLNIWTW